MKFHKIFFSIIILSLVANVCAIEEIKKIGISDAINIAIENSIELDTQKLNIEISKNDIKIANRLQNPSLDTYWNMGQAGAGNPHTIGVTQFIELFKRKHRKKVPSHHMKLAKSLQDLKIFKLKWMSEKPILTLLVPNHWQNHLNLKKNL